MAKQIIFAHLCNDNSGSPRVLVDVVNSSSAIDPIVLIGSSNSNGIITTKLFNSCRFYFYRAHENKFLKLVSYFLSQFSLFATILLNKKYRNSDCIYINTILPFGAAIAGWILGIQVYYHIHEYNVGSKNLSYLLRAIIKLVKAKVIFVSGSVAEFYSHYGIRGQVIHNTVSRSIFIDAMNFEYRAIIGSTFNVMMACSLKSYKGVDVFAAIAERFLSNQNIRFKLVLNAALSDFDGFKKKYLHIKNLEIIGSINDLEYLYKNTSLVLNLSDPNKWTETFGLTILEGFVYGIPAIAPNAGGPTELIDNGVNGFLVDSTSVDEVVNCITYLYENESECISFSKKARLKASRFSPEVFSNNIKKFLNV